MKKDQIGITKQEEWNRKWLDIFDHYQQDQRHAYYLHAILEDSDRKILEMGAGSFRDMALLNTLGVDCWGTDYSDTSVELAQKYFPSLSTKIFQSDAFNMSMVSDGEFDATFHNGLWVLFNDNDDLLKLAAEQARISRNKMLVTVHNGHNKDFVGYFHRLAQSDPLYRIRFFLVDEIRSLLLSVCRDVDIIPVGKGKKLYEDEMINQGKVSRLELRKFFDEAGLSHLEISERLLCVGYL